jgi:hypothetical protein
MDAAAAPRPWIGRSVPRVEDAVLLLGRSSSVDTFPFPTRFTLVSFAQPACARIAAPRG